MRGAIHLSLLQLFIPVARYAYPAIIPTILLLAFGWLECLSLLVKELGPDTPVIQTIFNPLSQAKNLAGREPLQGTVASGGFEHVSGPIQA